MKLLQETIDKEIGLPKHKANKHNTRKTIGCSAETIGCLYQFAKIKTEFKEIKDRKNAQRGLYWFTLNPELHPVFSETTEKIHLAIKPRSLTTTTKEVTLIPSRHTLPLVSTTTLRMLIMIPSKTHNTSQQPHKVLFKRYKGLHLLQNKSEINTR